MVERVEGWGENRPRLAVWSSRPVVGPVVGLYLKLLLTTSSPLVVLDTCPGRGPKWVPKCIDFGFDLVVLAVTGGWGSCFVSPLSSGETGGGMKGGRWWWWLNLVGSEEKAVKGLLVVKVLMGTV